VNDPSRATLNIHNAADFAAAFRAPRETLGRLELYESLLRQWQKAVNLVAPSTLDTVWHRHFADSAQLLDLAPGAQSWVDLGSGGGFPGLVVAILMAGDRVKPDDWQRRVTLIESDQRKCAFLREVVRKLGPLPGVAVDILSTRAESAATQVNLSLPEVVCARALAPLEKLLGLAAPLSTPATVGLFLKGKDAALELDAAKKSWKFNAELVPSRTQDNARIIVIRCLEPNLKD
jgi:16S rRNA (guanine527-N7)-methyltransferase